MSVSLLVECTSHVCTLAECRVGLDQYCKQSQAGWYSSPFLCCIYICDLIFRPKKNTCASSKLLKKPGKKDAGFFFKYFYLSRQHSSAKFLHNILLFKYFNCSFDINYLLFVGLSCYPYYTFCCFRNNLEKIWKT